MAHPQSDSRRVLVIDRNTVKLNLRATVLRNYEVEVHTACSLEEAPIFWTTNFYDLIMLEARENPGGAAAVSEHIRQLNPRQRIALLVGAPIFVQELARPPKGGRKTADQPTQPAAPFPSQWEETVQQLLTLVNQRENEWPRLAEPLRA